MNRRRNFRNRSFQKTRSSGGKCFLVLDFPDKLKAELKRVQGELSKKNFFNGRFSDVENLHLVLKSLGEVSREDLVLFKRRINELNLKKFEVSLSSLNVVSPNSPREIYTNLQGGEVWKLKEAVCGALRVEGEEINSKLSLVKILKFFDKMLFFEDLEKVHVCKKKFEITRFSIIEKTFGRRQGYRVVEDFYLN